MRHRKGNKKLSKPTDQRIALLRSLVSALFLHGKIKTTKERAKQASKLANKLIALSQRADLPSKKKVFSVLRDSKVSQKIFGITAERFSGRSGGCTRITHIGFRRGDAASMVMLELV